MLQNSDAFILRALPEWRGCLKRTVSFIFVTSSEMLDYKEFQVLDFARTNNQNYFWDQIRTIDRHHIVKILDTLSEKDIDLVKSIIHETYVA